MKIKAAENRSCSAPFPPENIPLMIPVMKTIILAGHKHCGKTSIGKILASYLEYTFHDMDDLTVEECQGAWRTPRQIWKNMGERGFRHLEEEAARHFVEWHLPAAGHGGTVLALGGGTAENTGAMAWLENRGTVVYLFAPEKLLFERIMAEGRPPFLSAENPEGDWAIIYKRRDGVYRKYASLIYEAAGGDAAYNARRLLVELEEFYGR